jgi:DNA-directed RNA polymerase subunit RPC12/RpoP
VKMQQAEYECRKCGRIYSSKEYLKSIFCSNCGSFLTAKLPSRPLPKLPRGRNGRKPFTFKPLLPSEPVNIHTLFAEFNMLPPIPYGGGLVRQSSSLWITERRRAYKAFRDKFSTDKLTSVGQLCEDYKEFLYFRNNLSWTNLHRTGLKALKQPEMLWDLITFIQDESVDIGRRINKGLQGELHIKGIGKNILTALLHTLHPDTYGVWNNRTQATLEILRRSPSVGHDMGLTYIEVNEKLLHLSRELDTDLTTIDGLMWYVSKLVAPKLM